MTRNEAWVESWCMGLSERWGWPPAHWTRGLRGVEPHAEMGEKGMASWAVDRKGVRGVEPRKKWEDGDGLLRIGPRGLRGVEPLAGMGEKGMASWAVDRKGVRGVEPRKCWEEVRDPRGSRPVRGAQRVGQVEGRGE